MTTTIRFPNEKNMDEVDILKRRLQSARNIISELCGTYQGQQRYQKALEVGEEWLETTEEIKNDH